MTTQTEQLKFAIAEINRSKDWRYDEGYDDDWRRWIDLYRGYQYEGARSENDRLIINIVFATVNVLVPAVSINNPKFSISARKPDAQAQAMLTQEILNYLWQVHRYQQDFRLAVLDFIIIGHGWNKVGYKFVKEPESKKADLPAGNSDLDAEAYEEGVDDRKDKEGNVESELNTTDDRPFVERISPFDIFVDPDARHPKEMRWIAQRTWRPLADVQVDSRYSVTARKKVGARSWSRWAGGADGDGRADDGEPARNLQYAEIFEFYDVKRGTVATLSIDSSENAQDADGGFLIKPKKMPYAAGHPFEMIRNFEVPDHFYPVGDIEQIESLQLELNETRNQMMNHRKRFARKWLYEKDAFDRDGVQALESDVDNAMIPVVSDGDPSKVIAPVPAVITPPEFYNQSDLISTDMDRVSGVSDYQRGAQTAIKRTATEAAMIQDASNSRAQDRLVKIEDSLARIGERIIQLMQQYLTGKHVARIISIPGAAWLEYDKDYIKGEFDYSVQGGSTEPQNETFKRQSAMQLVDASMPFLDAGVADPVKLYRKVLEGFGITDPTGYIMPQALAAGAPQVEQEGGPGGQPALPPGPQGPPPGGPGPGGPPPGGPGPGPGGPPPGGPPGEAILAQIPPEFLQQIPPEIVQGIASGQIPLPMVKQILEQLLAQQGGGAPMPGGPPPGPPAGPPPGMGGPPPGPGPFADQPPISGEAILAQLPPEILQMLPPEIVEGIATGAIPPPMVEQILMELMGQQGGGPPPPMM
jgi:hypothetical protein